MELQAAVSEKLNNSLIGNVFKVLVDRKEENYYVGRTEHDSPEVDPEVLIEGATDLQIGNFYWVRITGADEYDLYGSIAKETSAE